MVTNVTNFSRSGLFDWMFQRGSALILGVYFLFMLGFLIAHPDLTYAEWHGLFRNQAMRVFNTLVLAAITAHSWVGMWTISTDYLTQMALGKAATVVRFLFQAGCGILMFVFIVLGLQIFWGA